MQLFVPKTRTVQYSGSTRYNFATSFISPVAACYTVAMQIFSRSSAIIKAINFRLTATS